MTDTQLVDTIARAIFAERSHSILSLSWEDAIKASRSDRHDAGLHGMAIGSALREARAALAAMPQPIGYGIVSSYDSWDDALTGDTLKTLAEAETTRADLIEWADGRRSFTIVALVPIEAP